MRTQLSVTIICVAAITIILPRPSVSLSVTGLWSPASDFLKVVGRFGFLKSDVHHKDTTDGYIFGNVTSTFRSDESRKATLLLIDRNTFIRIIGGKKLDKSSLTCDSIFSVIDEFAYDEVRFPVTHSVCLLNEIYRCAFFTLSDCVQKCNDAKEADLIRHVPCPRGT